MVFKGERAVSTMSATGPSAGFCSSPSFTSNAEVVKTANKLHPVRFLFELHILNFHGSWDRVGVL